jgi:16S rRNA (guanine966-N2)-methyltransferase
LAEPTYLRIVAGEWRGRRIKVPPAGVRPTADRVREAWFSIIQPSVDGARVVDLCAGSGALGLEALSRGAAHCDFVEQDPAVRRVLEENIAALGAGARSTVHRGNALSVIDAVAADLPAPRWDLAFADPPYGTSLAQSLAERWLRAPFATIFGAEHEASLALPSYADGSSPRRRAYGITALTFYHHTEQDQT